MQLIDDLYTITHKQATADGALFTVRLNPACFIYKAHFPGHPVTPGVCIVQMAAELLSVAYGQTLRLAALKNVKFLAVVSPDADLELTVGVSHVERLSDGSVSARAELLAGGATKAKISMTCRP